MIAGIPDNLNRDDINNLLVLRKKLKLNPMKIMRLQKGIQDGEDSQVLGRILFDVDDPNIDLNKYAHELLTPEEADTLQKLVGIDITDRNMSK